MHEKVLWSTGGLKKYMGVGNFMRGSRIVWTGWGRHLANSGVAKRCGRLGSLGQVSLGSFLRD
jgi:hypothetical protein